MMKRLSLFVAAALAAGVSNIALAATGDTFVYRVSNGYNAELRGTVSYRVARTGDDRVEFAVTSDMPGAGVARTEIHTRDGNWLRHPLVNHDQPRDYEFARALPVYAPPGDNGGTWSVRVEAVDPVTGKRASVRVDGEVLGNERIAVPAGTFDTIKILRRVYAGDWDGFMRETHIVDVEWFAPALGRAVKSDSKSSWQDMSRCSRGGCPWFRGDWNISELARIDEAKP